MLPVTANEVNVPVEVMFGCAAVYTVPATNAFATCPDTFAPATAFALAATVALEANPVNAPVNVVADTLPALMLPVTANEVNVPVEVMFGCAAVVTVPAVVAAVAVPDKAPVNVVADTLPAVILPVTVNDVNEPTEVTFGCAPVVTVPACPACAAYVAFATVPETLAPATAFAVVA